MKEIWINLELYIESNEFSNFRDFFGFFLNFFLFLNNNKKLKMAKKGFIFAQDPRRCGVALRATWQSQADPCEHLHGAM